MSFLDERANLDGKVAVIAGGGGGLGRAIAVDLARAGVRLALLDRNEVLLDETVTVCRAAGVAVEALVGDARQPDTLEELFATADRRFERVDALVNVVGGTFRQPFVESTPRGWDAIIRTNFTWLLHSTHLAVTRMRSAGRGGSIINLTSIEAHRAAPGFAVYAGMKGAVTNFSRTLAVELAPDAIRVNTIAADMVPTEGTAAIEGSAGALSPGGDPAADELTATIAIPMGRRGRYEDVGNCALFLVSDLSSYVTGTTLHPDGGALASSGWFNWPQDGWGNTPPPRVVGGLLGADRA